MKEIKLNILGIRKIVFSRFEDQLLLIIYKNNNIVVKKISGIFVLRWRRVALFLSIVLFISISSFSISSIYDYSTSSENVDMTNHEDDVLKESILLSEETNYSAPSKNESLKIQEYQVKDGDTLSEIAKEYGVSAETICGSSGLTSYDVIHIGQKLKIPNKEGILYTVKKGDSLSKIAKNYRVNVSKIEEENPSLPSQLIKGMSIFIPDAKPMNIISAFMWPVASRRVTSAFGWRRHPIFRKRIFHSGLDIRANYQAVKAAKYGKVTYSGWMGGYGNAVVIAHPDGSKTLYGHLSSSRVKVGQYVKQGQHIAKSGNTGNSTGPHLHFEIIRKGKHVNPRKYLR